MYSSKVSGSFGGYFALLYVPAGVVKTYFVGLLRTSVMGSASGGKSATVQSFSTSYTHRECLTYLCLCHLVAPNRYIAPSV